MDMVKAVIESMGADPLAKAVLAQETSFQREVKGWYDFDIPKTDPQKNGRSPVHLVEILSGFSDQQFDTTKLEYDFVRENYELWNSEDEKYTKIARVTGILGPVCLFLPMYVVRSHPEIAIPIFAVGAVAQGVLFPLTLRRLANSESKAKLQEYHELSCSAKRADEFMDEHCRSYFDDKNG